MEEEGAGVDDEQFESTSRKKADKRKTFKNNPSSHTESVQEENECYMVGMKVRSLKEGAGCGALSEKHTVARWIKGEVGEVKLVDVKRSGLIVVECVSKCQMAKTLKISMLGDQLDVYSVTFPTE